MDGFEASSSPRYSFPDPITANMGGRVTFEAPELPEETLMEVRCQIPLESNEDGVFCVQSLCVAVTFPVLVYISQGDLELRILSIPLKSVGHKEGWKTLSMRFLGGFFLSFFFLLVHDTVEK